MFKIFYIILFLTLNTLPKSYGRRNVEILIDNSDTILTGLNGIKYVTLTNRTKIWITCNKLNNTVDGLLIASVNQKPAVPQYCNLYSLNNGSFTQTEDSKCLSKTFTYEFSYDDTLLDVFSAYCQIKGNGLDYDIIDIYKLYTDNLPRIRFGMSLYGSLNIYNQNDATISCEAIKDLNSSEFDDIQWFTSSNINLNITSKKFQLILNKYMNYSNELSKKELYNLSNYFKCCTVNNFSIRNCIEIYLNENMTTEASFKATAFNLNSQNSTIIIALSSLITTTKTYTNTQTTPNPITQTTHSVSLERNSTTNPNFFTFLETNENKITNFPVVSEVDSNFTISTIEINRTSSFLSTTTKILITTINDFTSMTVTYTQEKTTNESIIAFNVTNIYGLSKNKLILSDDEIAIVVGSSIGAFFVGILILSIIYCCSKYARHKKSNANIAHRRFLKKQTSFYNTYQETSGNFEIIDAYTSNCKPIYQSKVKT